MNIEAKEQSGCSKASAFAHDSQIQISVSEVNEYFVCWTKKKNNLELTRKLPPSMLANFLSDKMACRLLEKKKISMVVPISVLGDTATDYSGKMCPMVQ